MRRFIVILIVVLTVVFTIGATQRWEEVDTPPRAMVELQDIDESPIGIAVSDGYIYVSSEKRITVKVFTILGQLVSEETLPEGIHRFLMRAKGIYVVKIGARTHRVTI